jgi:hypothetical protein
MKTSPKFYTKNNDTVLALQKPDFDENHGTFQKAQSIWHTAWLEAGAEDHGTCCGGKGIEAWYVGPRKRSAELVNVVACSWVQGNLSAARTVDSALEYLRRELPEVEFRYNDGWMD